MTEADGRHALLRQEAIVAIVMNALMSIGFFFLIFGWHEATARDLAFDFVPQSLGVTVLGTFIPSLITMSRIKRGKVVPAGPVPSVGRHLLRIAGAAIFAVIVPGAIAGLLLVSLAPTIVAPLPALILKTIYGAALGRLMTPPIIRAVLGMPMFARHANTLAGATQ